MLKQLQANSVLPPSIVRLLHSPGFWFFFILFFGLLFRVYHWHTYPFGFDQVQILENAERITQGDITLIGPRTGPAPMFTGPLIYYVTAGLLFLIPSPYTVIATTLFFSVITGGGLFLLARWVVGRSSAWAMLALWAWSPFLIAMDRIPWNPNLSILASSLVFFPLYHLLKQPKVSSQIQLISLGLIGVGSFLGYQAHFSGLMIPVVVFVCAMLLRQFKTAFVAGCISSLGLLASLLPTIVFDARHEWLNVRGLLELGQTSSDTSLHSIFLNLISTVTVVVKNIGWIIFWDTNYMLPVFVGCGLVIWCLVNLRKKSPAHPEFWLPLLWIISSTLLFTIYKGDKPEYYFLLQIPAVLLLFDQTIIPWLRSNKVLVIMLGILCMYSLFYAGYKYSINEGMNFGNQLNVSKYVKQLSSEISIHNVTYDMKPVHSLGLQYLLQDLSLQESGRSVHIMYPFIPNTLVSGNSYDVGVWVDTRTNPERQYVTQPQYIIESPFTISLVPTIYPKDMKDGQDNYKILENNLEKYEFWVIKEPQLQKIFVGYWSSPQAVKDPDSHWFYYDGNDFSGWIYDPGRQVFALPISAMQKDTVIPLLHQLQILY